MSSYIYIYMCVCVCVCVCACVRACVCVCVGHNVVINCVSTRAVLVQFAWDIK